MNAPALPNLRHGLIATATADRFALVTRMIASARDAGVLDGMLAPAAEMAVLARERDMATGLGGGLAVPHGFLEQMEEPVLIVARCDPAVSFGAPDGSPAWLVCLLLAPPGPAEHLQRLAALARAVGDPTTCERLHQAESGQALVEAL